MSGATRPCPGCGSPVDPGTKFCGQCGHDLRPQEQAPEPGKPAEPAPQPPQHAEPQAKPPPQAQPPQQAEPAQPSQAQPQAPKPGADKRTMLGMPAVQMQRPGGEQASAPAQPPAQQPQQPPQQAQAPQQGDVQSGAPAPQQPARRPQRTMLGMSAPAIQPPGQAAGQPQGQGEPAQPQQPAQPADAKPAQRAPSPNTHRTMLGMTAPTAEDVKAQIAQQQQAGQPPPQGAGQGEQAAPAHAAKHLPAASNRTMLGMSAPQPGAAEAPGAPRRQSSAPPPPNFAGRSRAEVRYGSDFDLNDSDAYPKPKSGSKVGLVIGLLFAFLVVVVGGGIAAWVLLSGGADVRASVGHGDEGEVLEVEVPGAPAGTKVRFAGTESALEGGVATFPLPADALHVGDNELTIDVVGPGGDVEQAMVTLEVRYRVRPDLTALQRDPPAVAIQVDAVPGSEVTVDGEPLALDTDGHGEKALPLPETAGDDEAYAREVPYRIRLPEGPPADGVVGVRVPYAQMQLDRPGTNVTTDSERIEIAGAVHPGATVTVDGEPVEVNDDGRFVHTYALPEPDTYEPRVVARRTGRAPRVVVPTIRRVEDLAAEAASFEPDEGMSYARIQQNPAIYRGQKLALEGRVYNVNVQGGRSDIQILVRDCPRGQRCPLWVSYPAATDVTANDWVRVLGTVGGEQQFRSESNRVITVPRVDAQFVLPAEE